MKKTKQNKTNKQKKTRKRMSTSLMWVNIGFFNKKCQRQETCKNFLILFADLTEEKRTKRQRHSNVQSF